MTIPKGIDGPVVSESPGPSRQDALRAYTLGFAAGKGSGKITDCPWENAREGTPEAGLRHFWTRGFAKGLRAIQS